MLALSGAVVEAEDWPQFRGPTGQGHSAETGLPTEWSESQNVLWKTRVVGWGWSSPVVAEGRVWLTTAVDEGSFSLRVLAFDVGTGAVENKRPFIVVPEEDGSPDGMTVDGEGCLWVAHWDGWRVVRYDPDGTIERVIEMPVQRPTSCMFGGADLSVLYITSATMLIEPDDLAKQPMAGNLFALQTDARGLPEPKFAG